MHRREHIDAMMSDIAANIEKLEQNLQDEYKRLIQTSPKFDDIAVEFILLDRKSLSSEEKEYETASIVDKLCTRLDVTFGPDRDTFLMMQAALAIVDETSNAARVSRN